MPGDARQNEAGATSVQGVGPVMPAGTEVAHIRRAHATRDPQQGNLPGARPPASNTFTNLSGRVVQPPRQQGDWGSMDEHAPVMMTLGTSDRRVGSHFREKSWNERRSTKILVARFDSGPQSQNISMNLSAPREVGWSRSVVTPIRSDCEVGQGNPALTGVAIRTAERECRRRQDEAGDACQSRKKEVSARTSSHRAGPPASNTFTNLCRRDGSAECLARPVEGFDSPASASIISDIVDCAVTVATAAWLFALASWWLGGEM
jgi:hypothetical protein